MLYGHLLSKSNQRLKKPHLDACESITIKQNDSFKKRRTIAKKCYDKKNHFFHLFSTIKIKRLLCGIKTKTKPKIPRKQKMAIQKFS